MPAAETQPEPDQALPGLREDLRLLPGPRKISGAPSWIIYDPVQGRYVHIDQPTYRLLSLWPACRSIGDLLAAAAKHFGEYPARAEIEALTRFLHVNQLTVEPMQNGWRHFEADANSRQKDFLHSLVHNYLFFKIPMLRPERALLGSLGLVRWLGSRWTLEIVLLAGLLGLYLTSRQWDTFLATFPGFMTFEGAAIFGAALIGIKSLHELGHAYAAVSMGCRVPTMGLAFMVLAPMLYTDVTDAWKLPSRRQRLIIDLAGVAVEIGLACIATLLWVFLPDGVLRSTAFVVATTGWITSLLFNLNPLMRFDGYYVLTDLIGIENLQTRSFALGRWKMRELLFALGDPAPEELPPGLRTGLIAYAWATWVYRLIVFTGIALLVYVMFFKILGIVLFLIEIFWFILGPVLSELKEWWSMHRRLLRSRRALAVFASLSGLVILFLVPLATSVAVPAVVEDQQLVRLFPRLPADVATVHVAVGDRVRQGEPLLTFSSHALEHEIVNARRSIALAELRLGRRSADVADRSDSLVIEGELRQLRTKLVGLGAEQQELALAAPVDGTVVELDPGVHPGRAVARTQLLGVIRGTTGAVFRGFANEADLWRIAPGAVGRFVPDDPTQPSIDVIVQEIAVAGTGALDIPQLASPHGGPINARLDAEHRLVPDDAQVQVTMQALAGVPPLGHRTSGVVLVEGKPESFAARVARQVLKVLIRESGA